MTSSLSRIFLSALVVAVAFCPYLAAAPNMGPTIDGITITPSVGSNVYSLTPMIEITYSDPDADGIDPSSLHVDLNGLNITGMFAIDATHATVTLTTALTKGTNVLTVTVRDNGTSGTRDQIAALSSRVFEVIGPEITSVTPSVGRPGPTGTATVLTVSGNGLFLSGGDTINVGGILLPSSMASGISDTGFQVAIPDGAQTGALFVTINGVVSNPDKIVQVNYGAGAANVRCVTVNEHASLSLEPILFGDGGTHNMLYQAKNNGTPLALGGSINSPAGLGLDAANRTYWTVGQLSTLGPVQRWDPDTATTETWAATTKLTGEASPVNVGLTVKQTGSTISAYVADSGNQRIKRVNDTGSGAEPPVVIATGLDLANPAGLAVNSMGDTLYYTENNAIYKIPAPNGGPKVMVYTLAGSPRAIATIPNSPEQGGTEFLLFSRTAAALRRVSLIDPTRIDPITSKPFIFDLSGTRPNAPVGVAWDQHGMDPFVEVSEMNQVYRYPRPSLSLKAIVGSGVGMEVPVPQKIYADHNHNTDTDVPNQQIIVLQAKLDPITAFPNGYTMNGDYPPRVVWSFEDPDDPSTETTIDPDASGNDNHGSFDGFESNAFSQADPMYPGVPNGSTFETQLKDGVTRVVFHYSDAPGDNFIVKAQLYFPGFGKYPEPASKPMEAQTPIMTVWKKLHVERDGLSDAFATIEDDALLTADTMLPDTTLFGNAFNVCYVETVASGTDETIPFTLQNAHIDFTDDLTLDSLVGDFRQSPSSTGYWDVYLQGLYCTIPRTITVGLDVIAYQNNDPDNCMDVIPEGATAVRFVIGITNTTCAGGSGGPKESFIFNEVLRDRAENCSNIAADETYFRRTVALHEAGHQFSLLEGTGIMDPDGPQARPKFDPGAIIKIRTIPYPSCQP